MHIHDCHLQRGGFYIAKKGRIAPSAVVSQFSVVLGSISEGAQITRSYVGEGSSVAASARLNEVTLGKNVIVEENCVLSHCLVGDDCIVHKGMCSLPVEDSVQYIDVPYMYFVYSNVFSN